MIRAAALALLLLLVAPVGLAGPGGHDREGTVHVGTGYQWTVPGVTHIYTFAPVGATGVDIEGDVRYEYLRMFDGSGTYYRVTVFATLGALEVPWALDWVFAGPADVTFVGSYGSDCRTLTCLEDGPA